ncbi:hypothetical protein [Inhella sp.]|uniref:hypothetical protein n=1 Tax=Inhella sp. TaxID=1921806 RepID=UPI0035B2E352
MNTPIAAPRPAPAHPARHWPLALAAWLLLYLLALGLGELPGLQALGQAAHTGSAAHGHPYADTRSWLGLPFAADTLSNLPFVLLALLGAGRLRRHPLQGIGRRAAWVFCAGLLLTGLGSAAFHLAPSAGSLVLDRLGMAVAFAGLLGLASTARLGEAAGRWLLPVYLPLALLAAALPGLGGTVWPWAVAQYGGVLWLLGLCLLPQPAGALRLGLAWVLLGYALAKLFEGLDAAIFAASAEWVSGHTLKHLAAAAACWPVLASLAKQDVTSLSLRPR